MNNPRKYGRPPYTVAVVHGGPGAPGQVAPVARELSKNRGVIEPLQTASTLEGQVKELKAMLEANAKLPAALVGHSWGAMLAFITAARFPECCRKLIMVGSGVFEEKWAAGIEKTRMSRLDAEERREIDSLSALLSEPGEQAEKDEALARLGAIFTKADAFDPATLETEVIECQNEVNVHVWRDARSLRASGRLLEMGRMIRCPVVAIHGDYDPHPASGIEGPLSTVLSDFRFILLEKCGHVPWIEKEARQRFYEILEEELSRD